jgi:hypothetical protein
MAIHQLQPGQTATQPRQSRNQDQKHQNQPATVQGWLGANAGMAGPGSGSAGGAGAQLRTARPPGGMAPGGGSCHQYPAGTGPIFRRARRPGLRPWCGRLSAVRAPAGWPGSLPAITPAGEPSSGRDENR